MVKKQDQLDIFFIILDSDNMTKNEFFIFLTFEIKIVDHGVKFSQ